MPAGLALSHQWLPNPWEGILSETPFVIIFRTVSAGDTITKDHRFGGLNNRDLFFMVSGDWTSNVKVPAGAVFGEGSFLGYRQLPSH